MRFTVKWWESDGIHEEKHPILDDALARGEQLWGSGKVRKVTVWIDREVAWEQPAH
jgi:hypothetical protein